MEQQQHGFSDSTPRAGSDRLQKSAKSLPSALQLMSNSTSKESFRPIRTRHENFEIIFLLISQELNNFFEFFLSIL